MMFVPEASENMWLLLLCVLEMPQSGCYLLNFHMQSCPLILFFPMYKLLNWVLDVFAQLRPFFLYLHTTWIRVAVTSSISAAQRINASTFVKHTTSLLLSNLYPRNLIFLPSLFTEEFSVHQARSSSPQTSHSPSFPLTVPSSPFALFFSQNLCFQMPPSNFSSPLFFLFLLKSLNCHKNPTPTIQILLLEKKIPLRRCPFFFLPSS